MLENISRGDTAVFANGEEALIENRIVTVGGNFHLYFDHEVLGWIDEVDRDWVYEPDGKFARGPEDRGANNIMKVIHECI